jgi:hypothetical protein
VFDDLYEENLGSEVFEKRAFGKSLFILTSLPLFLPLITICKMLKSVLIKNENFKKKFIAKHFHTNFSAKLLVSTLN